MFSQAVRPEISQGDVFTGMDVFEVLGGREERYEGALILLSHDCEFDKQHEFALVARVLPLDSAPRSSWPQIRRGEALNAIHLPGVGDQPESFVNLRYIHRFPKGDLRQADLAGRRVASMTDDGRSAFVGYVYRFLARELP